MSKIIGIDLGTTNSAVAYIEGGEPRIIENAEGNRHGDDDAVRRGGERVGAHQPGLRMVLGRKTLLNSGVSDANAPAAKKSIMQKIASTYSNFKFWDWVANLVGAKRSALVFLLLGILLMLWSGYMGGRLQFAKGKVQFFPTESNLHQFELAKSDFSAAIEDTAL